MKNQIFLFSILSIFLSISTVFGQKEAPHLPIDSLTNKITYSEIVYVDSLTNKHELFVRAREWLAKVYRSSTDVIQMEDKENGIIVGKALVEVFFKYLGLDAPGGYIHYTISIYTRDGRYKYEITDFYHTGKYVGNQDFGVCEKWINTTHKTLGISNQKFYNSYLNQMDRSIKRHISDLKSAMASRSINMQEDNW